jgi:hypothetical protein
VSPSTALEEIAKIDSQQNIMTIDSPELAAGQSGSISALPTPTTTQTAVPGLSSAQAQFMSKHDHHGSNTAAIVGGVLGGIIFIASTIVLMLWYQRIKRRRTTRAAAAVILGNRGVPLQEKKRNRDDPPPDQAVFSSAI